MSPEKDAISYRPPNGGDGLRVHRLIADSPPLDLNSVYSYYLFGIHFRDTSIVAEQSGELLGFISAYRVPNQPDTLFVWQVVVSLAARGQGIARHMLDALLARFDGEPLKFVEATLNPSNKASRGLFERLARSRGSRLSEREFLSAAAFGAEGDHEPEILLRIPLNP